MHLFLFSGPAQAQDNATAPKPEAHAPEPEAPRAGAQEIVFQGKIYCSLKRNVIVPFQGEIIALQVQAGQKVSKGDPLLTFRLDPEVISQLRGRLSPAEINDLQARRAQVMAQLTQARSKYQEVKQLAEQRMASTQKKEQLSKEIGSLNSQVDAIQRQLDTLKQAAADDLISMKQKLGDDLDKDNIPAEIQVRSPIDGHVTWINTEIRAGAEVPGGTPAMIVGVMDPMLIRAHLFEIEASQITTGDRAQVSLGSLPGRTFEAVLSRISWTPVTPGLDKPSYYEVELTAPNPDLVLKEGFKTQVVFQKSD